MKANTINIEISVKSLFVVTLFVVLLLLAWQIRLIFVFLFFAFIINSALRPYVDYFENKRIPRIIAISGIYILLFLVSTIVMVTIFSDTVSQLKNLFALMPQLLTNLVREAITLFPWLEELIDVEDFRAGFVQELSTLSNVFSSGISGVYSIINSAFATVTGLVTIVMVSIYMLVRKEEVYESFVSLLPVSAKRKERYSQNFAMIEEKLGAWLRAQLFLMLFISLLTWFGLVTPATFSDNYNMHQYALPIAFIAGILEAVPNIGPVLTAIIAVVIAIGSGSSLWAVLYVVVLFIVIQQLEAIFIAPKLIQKIVGVDPILTILGVIGSFIILGPIGPVMIVPIIATLQIVLGSELNRLNERNAIEVVKQEV